MRVLYGLTIIEMYGHPILGEDWVPKLRILKGNTQTKISGLGFTL